MYGEQNATGKVGTDIEEGKCSWLIATALEKASSEQRDALGVSCIFHHHNLTRNCDIRAYPLPVLAYAFVLLSLFSKLSFLWSRFKSISTVDRVKCIIFEFCRHCPFLDSNFTVIIYCNNLWQCEQSKFE